MNQFIQKDNKKIIIPEVTKEEVAFKESAPNENIQTVKKIFNSLNVMSYINKEMVMKIMPFAFFMLMLGLLYIGNSYRTEKEIRDIDAMNKELKELRSEYIAGKSELMIKSRQSSVAQQVEKLGLKESVNPPRKIIEDPNANLTAENKGN